MMSSTEMFVYPASVRPERYPSDDRDSAFGVAGAATGAGVSATGAPPAEGAGVSFASGLLLVGAVASGAGVSVSAFGAGTETRARATIARGTMAPNQAGTVRRVASWPSRRRTRDSSEPPLAAGRSAGATPRIVSRRASVRAYAIGSPQVATARSSQQFSRSMRTRRLIHHTAGW